MPRSAATRSCSTTTVSAPRFCSVAGDSVPQNGQTSACFAGVPVRVGAAGGALVLFARCCRRPALSPSKGPALSKEFPERRLRDPPLRADLPALEIARLEARNHVRLRDAERRRRLGRADQLGQPPHARRQRPAPPAASPARRCRPAGSASAARSTRRPRARRQGRRRRCRLSRAPAPSGTSRSRSGCRPPPCSSACRSPPPLPAAPRRFRG